MKAMLFSCGPRKRFNTAQIPEKQFSIDPQNAYEPGKRLSEKAKGANA